MKFILRWLITSAALVAAVYLVPGITVEGNATTAILVTALVLGLLNALVRPLLTLMSCGFIVLTLGLGLLVINAVTLWLASWISTNWLHVGFYVDGFWSAFLGALIVSVVSFILSIIFKDDKRHHRKSNRD